MRIVDNQNDGKSNFELFLEKLKSKKKLIIGSTVAIIILCLGGVSLFMFSTKDINPDMSTEQEQIYRKIGVKPQKEKITKENKETAKTLFSTDTFKLKPSKKGEDQETTVINYSKNEITNELNHVNENYVDRFEEEYDIALMEQLIDEGKLASTETMVYGVSYEDYLQSVAHYWYNKPSYDFTYRAFEFQTDAYNNLIKDKIYKEKFDTSKMSNFALVKAKGKKEMIANSEVQYKLVFTYNNKVYEAKFGMRDLKPNLLDMSIKG